MRPSDADPKSFPFDAPDTDEALPFRVDLWDRARDRPDRVIGRAATLVLAQAIYQAAQSDFAGERITLSRGDRIVLDTR